MPVDIRPLRSADRPAWQRLWTDYLTFYESSVSPEVYDTTFARLLGEDPQDFDCLVAEADGELVGLTHFLFHRHNWSVEDTCYLQVLYADPAVRGQGVGRRLIEAVYAAADAKGCPSVYWLTQDDNATARVLYDRVGQQSNFIKYLRAGGRAAIVIKNTVLSNTDNASVALRKLLLESCSLHTILDMPGGTFTGAGVKTVTLFFQKGEPTKNIWYYQLDPGRNMGKTNPLNDTDMEEFVTLASASLSQRAETEKSWNIKVADIDETTVDLSTKNPNTPEEAPLRSPEVILAEMETLDAATNAVLKSIKALL